MSYQQPVRYYVTTDIGNYNFYGGYNQQQNIIKRNSAKGRFVEAIIAWDTSTNKKLSNDRYSKEPTSGN